MREYLKAIGFSDLNSRKKIDELINEIKKNPSRKNWFQIDEEEAISGNRSFLSICSRCELPVS